MRSLTRKMLIAAVCTGMSGVAHAEPHLAKPGDRGGKPELNLPNPSVDLPDESMIKSGDYTDVGPGRIVDLPDESMIKSGDYTDIGPGPSVDLPDESMIKSGDYTDGGRPWLRQ